MTSSACILFFVKIPRPGQVKTRLAKTIGTHHATQIYQCFVQDIWQQLQSLAAEPLVFYAPTTEKDSLRWLNIFPRYYPQQGDNLGQRMMHACLQAFNLGFEQALIIGSDSPDLPPMFLVEALRAIAQDTVAIGPTADGGYYTLGLSQAEFLPEIFQAIPWSTATVLAKTLEVLQHHQKKVHRLPLWFDIDTWEDLEAFYYRNQISELAPYTMQYLTQHWPEISTNPELIHEFPIL